MANKGRASTPVALPADTQAAIRAYVADLRRIFSTEPTMTCLSDLTVIYLGIDFLEAHAAKLVAGDQS